MQISSDFAILDVKEGRHDLANHFSNVAGHCPKKMRIPVVIHGYIDSQWGCDDGTSTEFAVVVTSIDMPENA